MILRDAGICTVVLVVLEWSFSSSNQNFGRMDVQEFDHLGYVLEIARSPVVASEVDAGTSSLSQQVGMTYYTIIGRII